MTEDKKAALRLLLNQHSWTVRSGIVKALSQLLPVPAVQRAIRNWERTGRREEFRSLEDTVDRILDVLHQPVTKTVLVNRRGCELDLVTLPQAAVRLGYQPCTLADLRGQRPDFPEPLITADTGSVWVFEDVESWVAARDAEVEFRGRNKGRRRKVPDPGQKAG